MTRWFRKLSPWHWLGLAVLSYAAIPAEIALLGLVQTPQSVLAWAANIIISSLCLITSFLFLATFITAMCQLSGRFRKWVKPH